MQEIARSHSERVLLLDHLEMRMLEREITRKQVMTVLRNGECVNPPEWDTNKESGWKVKIRRISAGVPICLVAKLVDRGDNEFILLITAYEEY